MSIADAVSRISQIEQQLAQLSSGSIANIVATANASDASSTSGATGTAGSSSATNFANALATAQGTGSTGATGAQASAAGTGSSFPTLAGSEFGASGSAPSSASQVTGGVALPASAGTMLSSGQQQFASTLSAQTGLNPGVVSAWLLSEESGGAAQSRQAAGNNDWLNIGYTDSGTFGSGDSVWSDPVTAANATAGWLKGQNTIPGYGTASSGIQGILSTVGEPPAAQIQALQHSGWASSGYPSLPSLYAQVAG